MLVRSPINTQTELTFFSRWAASNSKSNRPPENDMKAACPTNPMISDKISQCSKTSVFQWPLRR